MLSDCLDEDEQKDFVSNQTFTHSFIKLTQMDKGKIPNQTEAVDAYTIITEANGDEGKVNVLSEIYNFVLSQYAQEALCDDWLNKIYDYIQNDENYQQYCKKRSENETFLQIVEGKEIHSSEDKTFLQIIDYDEYGIFLVL